MFSRIVLMLLLVAVVAQVRGATETERALVKGTVILNGEDGPGVANVQITDSAHTGGPWATGSDGGFTLDYPTRAPGERVRLGVIKDGYVVVNWVQLDLALPKDPNANPLQIIICKEADREEMAQRFYQLKGAEAVEKTYQQKLKALEEENKSDAATIAKLQEERDQAKAGVEKAAAELAKNHPGQGSEMYQEAERLYLDGKIDAAIALLDDDKLRRSAEQAEKALTDAIQGWRLKANLFTLKFRFEESEKAYEMALHYINRETNPRLWAETEVDLGITHRKLGIRVEGKAGNEHLTGAITAYRSALEVYTREQLPQAWAATQDGLGNALSAQADRTEGTKGAELLAQAVSAYRSALEVRTRGLLRQEWAATQNNLGVALRAQAARTEGTKGAELLAQAVSAHRSATKVFEQLPQDLAVIQNNLGIDLRAQAARTDGTKGAALLAQAVSAYRSALEVRTREQMPQDWAKTQNNLGAALRDQADRTAGTKGAELLAQAVAAFHSCLEIYTPEAFPLDHKRAQEQLMECERLLTQTKVQAQQP
jgi:predicted hotdog family 3-hydroxylacyl-ACP dehydratase